MSKDVILTIATTNRLHGVLALFESIRTHQAAQEFVFVVVDPLSAELRLPSWVTGLPAEALGIPRWKRFSFKYDPMALCCALKPYAVLHVLGTLGAGKVLYFDSDICVYQPLRMLYDALDSCSILLTPHFCAPLKADGSSAKEDLCHQTGIYNMGFLGVRNTPEAMACLRWWSGKLADRCVKRLEMHLCHDQNFMSAVPALFSGVQIERGAEYNMAPWNLERRPIDQDSAGHFTVNGRPLAFFHFSGFSPGQEDCLAGRAIQELPAAVQSLVREYSAKLKAHDCVRHAALDCHLKYLTDGTVIRPIWREAIRLNYGPLGNVEDPFSAAWRDKYLAAEDDVRELGLTPTEYEAWRWRDNYRRLASSFPVKQMLWLRRRWKGHADPFSEEQT